MGDRANVYVKMQYGEGGVYLYSHWGGYALPQTLQTALQRHERWDDDAYLTRIIFCQMVKGDEDGETGFGISAALCDNEHPIIHVDPAAGTVSFRPEDEIADEPSGCSWTFQEFCDLSEEELHKHWTG
jgi:hypothetical protein